MVFEYVVKIINSTFFLGSWLTTQRYIFTPTYIVLAYNLSEGFDGRNVGCIGNIQQIPLFHFNADRVLFFCIGPIGGLAANQEIFQIRFGNPPGCQTLTKRREYLFTPRVIEKADFEQSLSQLAEIAAALEG